MSEKTKTREAERLLARLAEAGYPANLPTDDDEPTISQRCLHLLFVLVFGTAAHAGTLYALWGWFAVPLGAPHLGVPHLLGLFVLGSMLIPRKYRLRNSTKESLQWGSALAIFVPLWALGLGWVFHAMM